MDFKLAKEIYGNAWFVDPLTLQQLTKMLDFYKSGGQIEKPEIKNNSFGIIDQSNVFTAQKIKRMENVSPGTIAMYNFDSVITKYGGMSHYGTTEIAAQFRDMEANENVIGHMFVVESGGGSANAIKYIREVSAKENRTKPLVTYFEDINGSAAYYISSDSDYIIANSKDAMVGSIGTMIQMEGYKSGEEDKTGKRHLRIYASQSTNKNIEFEKAINDLDFELIRSNILDPHAAQFISDMEKNRPNITAKQKTGAIFRAEETMGTLIDEIGSFQMAIDKVRELAQETVTPSGANINNQNEKIMDLATLKAEHPAVYQAAKDEGVTAGVKQERDRVEAWAVFNEVNPEKVKAGIESGEPMTAKDTAEMSLQIAKGGVVAETKKDNPEEVNTPEAKETEEEVKAKAQKAEMDKLFGEDK